MTLIDAQHDFRLLAVIDPVTNAVTDLWSPECNESDTTVDILSVSIHWALAYMLQVRTNSPIVLLGGRLFEESRYGQLDDYMRQRNFAMRIERMRRFTTQALLAKSGRSYIECIFSSEGIDESADAPGDLWIAGHLNARRNHEDLMMSYQELKAWLNGDWFSCRRVNDWMSLVLDAGLR